MIIAELEIEDYKQFAGLHVFRPAETSIVGIVGANGVGKTTLFEAIEWCLFQPREIAADEVRPRGRPSTPRVKLTVQDTVAGQRYVVERTLKKSGANAELYREDEPETRIVHGSRQVTEYVVRSLIGLSHRAFVSTFFTRQKELTFFGNLRETDRRREVGRLLGFETIRDAQRKIGQDRTAADNEAKVLIAQHQEQSAGRDFLGEASAAEQAVASCLTASEEAEVTLAAASEELVVARDALTRLRDLERQDAEIRRELERVAGDERAAAARRDAVQAAIADLDQAANVRIELEPVAAAEAGFAAAIKQHEAAREQYLQRQRLEKERERAEHGIATAASEVRRAVNDADAGGLAGWSLSLSEAGDPVAAADRLIAVAEAVDLPEAQRHAAALMECFDRLQARNLAEQQVRRFEERLAHREQERAAIVKVGDPAAELVSAQSRRETALRSVQDAINAGQNAKKTLAELEPVVVSLESRRFDSHCPTCGRPFAEHEVGITLAALSDRVEDLRTAISDAENQRRRADDEARTSEAARSAAERRVAELHKVEGQISQGKPMVDDARKLWEDHIRACQDALEAHGLDREPTATQVADATSHAALLDRVVGTLPLLRQLRATAQQYVLDRDSASQTLADQGEVVYDKAAHEETEQALQRARAAVVRIAQIDRELARRPERLDELNAANADLARQAEERRRLEATRTETGFDQAALELASTREREALTTERDAVTACSAAIADLNAARSSLDVLLADQQRIAGLLDRSAARQRQADLLEQMYREFTLFDQYVAGVVTPQLAEHASELLGAVTEGKYDHVDFDDNYGIQIYDGDEKFPMEEFSGGERDVIALCARLALSRLIGNQAVNPPGFLVLDEVFGSLDRDRRVQVLETFGALSGTAEAFQQLFIISHVDDVRFSPVFSEVWRVSETADGVSQIENLNLTGGAEEA